MTLTVLKKRLSSQESRAAALEAAQDLLIETGPQSVTLKAVAARVGRTHANLLHHFGSAAGLQEALSAHLAHSVCDRIGQAVRATCAGQGNPREVVDLIFDAFGREGGGALASWMLVSGNEDALNPILRSIDRLVNELVPGESKTVLRELTLSLVLLALGDALLGDPLSRQLDVQRSAARDRAEIMLGAAFEQREKVAA